MILIVEFNIIHDNCIVGIIAEVLKFDSLVVSIAIFFAFLSLLWQ